MKNSFTPQPLRSNWKNVGFFGHTKMLRKCDVMDSVKKSRATKERQTMVQEFRTTLKSAAEHIADKRGGLGLKVGGMKVARIKRVGQCHHVVGFGLCEDLNTFEQVKSFLRKEGFTGVRRGAVVIKLV